MRPPICGVDPGIIPEIAQNEGPKSSHLWEKPTISPGRTPNLVLPIDMDAFGVDFGDAHGLWTLHNMVQQVKEGIADTEMIAESEAYQWALAFYKSVKMATAQDISGAKASCGELKTSSLRDRTGSIGSRTVGSKSPACLVLRETGLGGSPNRFVQDRTSFIERQTIGAQSPVGSVQKGTGLVERGIVGVKSIDSSIQDRTSFVER